MKQTYFTIEDIPATLWGEERRDLFIAVHGNLSHKQDTIIQLLAEEAVQKGFQVLSFDLPEHGDRKYDGTPCKVQSCVSDLMEIAEYAKSRWRSLRLFACSMGAYFSLLAYPDTNLKKALFLSPVVDMERIILNMMNWFQVTPDRLQEEKTIPTPTGQNLYWDYYCYVRDHPIERWDVDTHILYGGRDNLVEFDTISQFTEKYRCSLEIMKTGEHYFHTDEELQMASRWLHNNMV